MGKTFLLTNSSIRPNVLKFSGVLKLVSTPTGSDGQNQNTIK